MKLFLQEEKDKFKEMTFAEKRWYIWEYYKFHIIGGIIGLYFITSLTHALFFSTANNHHLYIAWSANHVSIEQMQAIEEVLNVIAIDYKDDVSVRSYTEVPDPEMNMALRMRLMALMSSSDVDIIITHQDEAVMFYDQNFLLSFDNIVDDIHAISPDLYAVISERFLITDEIPSHFMIDLANSPLLTSLGIPSENVYLGIIGNTTRLESVIEAIALFVF